MDFLVFFFFGECLKEKNNWMFLFCFLFQECLHIMLKLPKLLTFSCRFSLTLQCLQFEPPNADISNSNILCDDEFLSTPKIGWISWNLTLKMAKIHVRSCKCTKLTIFDALHFFYPCKKELELIWVDAVFFGKINVHNIYFSEKVC